jgi:DNA recombination protein RmuC
MLGFGRKDIRMLEGIALAVAVVIAAVAACLAAVFAARGRGLVTALAEAKSELQAERFETGGLRERLATAYSDRTEARTRLDETERALAAVKAEFTGAARDRDEAREARQAAEKAGALERQAREAVERRLADWETAKAESLTHAKAAVLETATAVSSKLIEDHKRETEAARQERDQRLKGLTDQFDSVVKSVAALADQTNQTKAAADIVWQALSSPGGAGHFAEIGLGNTLTSFGLQRDRDFVLQGTIEGDGDGRKLRPDAIIFLPNSTVLVIDCKASKFLLEIAAADGSASEDEAYANLARTMGQHLRALAGKDYKSAIIADYRQAGRSGEVARVLNVMYLPNEAALDRVRRADPDFERRAQKEQIMLAGPTSLACIVSFASMDIGLGRQAENQERIVEATTSLLDGIAIALSHVEGVGKGVKAAAASFEKFAASVNARLLPRARLLASLGVKPTKSKALPSHLGSIQVVDTAVQNLIEGEAEEITPANLVAGPPAGSA